MELQILGKLEFYLTCPTSLRFLERYSKLADPSCNSKLFCLSNYMLEISLIDLAMNKWNPSLQACSSIYITKKILHLDEPWSAFLTRQTGHSE